MITKSSDLVQVFTVQIFRRHRLRLIQHFVPIMRKMLVFLLVVYTILFYRCALGKGYATYKKTALAIFRTGDGRNEIVKKRKAQRRCAVLGIGGYKRMDVLPAQHQYMLL